MRPPFFVGLLGGSVIGMILTIMWAELSVFPGRIAKERAKAIEAGVAQWTVDSKTGTTQFTYSK